MILTDSGPLVAMLDRDDPYHDRCIGAFPALSTPMITTLPVITETSHFLARHFGWSGQERLWQLVKQGVLEIVTVEGELLKRLPELMEQYRDSPYFEYTEEFCAKYDQTAFDSDYRSEPLEHFESLVRTRLVTTVPAP